MEAPYSNQWIALSIKFLAGVIQMAYESFCRYFILIFVDLAIVIIIFTYLQSEGKGITNKKMSMRKKNKSKNKNNNTKKNYKKKFI